MNLAPPEPIGEEDDLSEFDCCDERMNRWLRERGGRSEGRTSRTYVVRADNGTIAGYYSLAAGSLTHADAPGRLRRNTPDPIPIIVLGRLAVDRRCQGRGLGSAMVVDAMRRTVAAARVIGARGLLVHVLAEDVLAFYLKLGFSQTPVEDAVVLPIETIEQALLES